MKNKAGFDRDVSLIAGVLTDGVQEYGPEEVDTRVECIAMDYNIDAYKVWHALVMALIERAKQPRRKSQKMRKMDAGIFVDSGKTPGEEEAERYQNDSGTWGGLEG